ncbi:hypothetical protein EIN_155850 [Entamoeba invadens IP1]|uniref:Uncharacterized protein n=1 Tax=Entamoeba invadens IP1 TaxID=370355 RepID=A0A0A1UCR5_ENTIV|nr:hypothetical protein EIN_155850 [Entamoeba invadens IP1]ELP91458.1 hypothetical protein EIN_155850 [Entamoeba invadens IP1]|eukprot:XP_004258229.1 hypothetical protein EIN_155850 [Entamoeba invadens IP1]
MKKTEGGDMTKAPSLHIQLLELETSGLVFRFQLPSSLAYKHLHFYSYGLMKERISKTILMTFGTASPNVLSRLREYIIATKSDIASDLEVDDSTFDVLVTECFLSGGKALKFGEDVVDLMFSIGLKKYVSDVKNKKARSYKNQYLEQMGNDAVPVSCF